LKKCIPITRSGCWSPGDRVDRDRRRSRRGIASGETIPSSSANTSRFGSSPRRSPRHEIAVGEVGEVGRDGEPAERRVAFVGGRLALLDRTPDVVLDRLAGALAELLVDLPPDRLETRLRRDLRDPGAHRAQADDSHPTNHVPDATEEVPPLARLGVK
jgi:hypothetical protein